MPQFLESVSPPEIGSAGISVCCAETGIINISQDMAKQWEGIRSIEPGKRRGTPLDVNTHSLVSGEESRRAPLGRRSHDEGALANVGSSRCAALRTSCLLIAPKAFYPSPLMKAGLVSEVLSI